MAVYTGELPSFISRLLHLVCSFPSTKHAAHTHTQTRQRTSLMRVMASGDPKQFLVPWVRWAGYLVGWCVGLKIIVIPKNVIPFFVFSLIWFFICPSWNSKRVQLFEVPARLLFFFVICLKLFFSLTVPCRLLLPAFHKLLDPWFKTQVGCSFVWKKRWISVKTTTEWLCQNLRIRPENTWNRSEGSFFLGVFKFQFGSRLEVKVFEFWGPKFCLEIRVPCLC